MALVLENHVIVRLIECNVPLIATFPGSVFVFVEFQPTTGQCGDFGILPPIGEDVI